MNSTLSFEELCDYIVEQIKECSTLKYLWYLLGQYNAYRIAKGYDLNSIKKREMNECVQVEFESKFIQLKEVNC